jgi:hypothetical protein
MKYINTLIALLLLSGCATTPKYDQNGIPKIEYKVGGGGYYTGVAKKNGTFMVVEEKTNRIVATGEVKKGDPMTYQILEDQINKDGKGFEESYGIPYSEARFSAYLIP